jgi:hypothetical protein
MQQIRIVDDATRSQDATRIQDTENMRLMLSDEPDQTWIARLRHLIAATEPGVPRAARGGPHARVRVRRSCGSTGAPAAHRAADRPGERRGLRMTLPATPGRRPSLSLPTPRRARRGRHADV